MQFSNITPDMTIMSAGIVTVSSDVHPEKVYSVISMIVSGSVTDVISVLYVNVSEARTTVYVTPSYSTSDGTTTSVSVPV